jgi:hypothetical protein
MGVLAIDCGKTGALCFHDGSYFHHWHMPYTPDNEVDLLELSRITYQLPIETIIIEEQTSFASDGRFGAFTMGLNYGRLLAWAEKRCSHLCRVRPQVWQAYHGIQVKHPKEATSAEKKRATKLAAYNHLKKLHPQIAERCLGKRGGLLDGLVDAILIAIWGYNERGHSYLPTSTGFGCFPHPELTNTPKGAKGRQRSSRSGGKR